MSARGPGQHPGRSRSARGAPGARIGGPARGGGRDDDRFGGKGGGKGGFDRDRGGFDRDRGGFDRDRGGFDRDRGPPERGDDVFRAVARRLHLCGNQPVSYVNASTAWSANLISTQVSVFLRARVESGDYIIIII